MFGSLDDYLSDEFTASHADILFDTPTEHRVCRVFAAFQSQILPEGSDAFAYYNAIGKLPEKRYNEVLAHFKDMSLIHTYTEPQYPTQILMLSTCSYNTENGRFVVAAYRVS